MQGNVGAETLAVIRFRSRKEVRRQTRGFAHASIELQVSRPSFPQRLYGSKDPRKEIHSFTNRDSDDEV